jgi:hypothetical protein
MMISVADEQLDSLDPNFIQSINSENPFDRNLFVKQQQIWERQFVDIPSLNAEASDFVLKAVEAIRARTRTTLGITLIAERGLGKSHLISRICHQLRMNETAFFVYMGDYNNLHQLKNEFLQEVAYSFKHSMRAGYMQWQELATTMANRSLKKKVSVRHFVDDLIPRQENFVQHNGGHLSHLINHLCKNFSDCYPHVQNRDLVRAIFWTLSKSHVTAAINWLAGNEITPYELQELGLPSIADSETFNSFKQAQQILDLVNIFHPVVICLDELDSLHAGDSSAKPRSVASLAKDILNGLKRGVVLTTMYPQTWKNDIKTMPQAEGIIDRIGEKVLELQYLNNQGVKALVTAWLDEFYFEKKYMPETPIYPFLDAEIQMIGNERPTFRAALQDCRQLFSEKIKVPPVENKVQPIYQKVLEGIQNNIAEMMEDSEKIANALQLAFSLVVNQTVAGVKVLAVEKFETVGSADQKYVQFKVIAEECGETAKIGISVLQNQGGNGVTACLKRLVDYKKFDLTRGCLVRSKNISSSASQARQLVQELIVNKKGEWVWLLSEHIGAPLALYEIYERREDHELTEAEISSFLSQQKIIIDNPLIGEILSEPSGRVPESDECEQLITRPGGMEQVISTTELEASFGDRLSWIYSIVPIATRSLELAGNKISNYQAGTNFEQIIRRSLDSLGFTVDADYAGGAGCLDLYCSKPFPLVAECKSGQSIPNNAIEELLKLGRTHLGKDGFESATKLVIGPGKPTKYLLDAADAWGVSILSPQAIQKLTEANALYPGVLNMMELPTYLKPGIADEQVEAFINNQMAQSLNVHTKVIILIQEIAVEYPEKVLTAENLLQLFRERFSYVAVGDHTFHDVLIELSSPLTGYLKRDKGNQKWEDRFYYLRDLPAPKD